MKVSDQGVVSLGIERMTEDERRAVHHDPGYREAVRSWQDRINNAVQDVTDADAGVRIALQAVVVDESLIAGGRGFNGEAENDIEKYEGQAAEEALAKLGGGDRLSDKETAELRRTFRDSGDDPAFSRTLLDGLGATGTIKLTNELNDLIHVRGGDRARDYSAIETGLADALASATKDTSSQWYENWRAPAGGSSSSARRAARSLRARGTPARKGPRRRRRRSPARAVTVRRPGHPVRGDGGAPRAHGGGPVGVRPEGAAARSRMSS